LHLSNAENPDCSTYWGQKGQQATIGQQEVVFFLKLQQEEFIHAGGKQLRGDNINSNACLKVETLQLEETN
jgi:hypothetical protein